MNTLVKLPLNVLLTKRCNVACKFCVEETKIKTPDLLNHKDFAKRVNTLIAEGKVSDVLLLGGEPLYFKGILELIQALDIPPIITTNGSRLVQDPAFLKAITKLKVRGFNISLPHYSEKQRLRLMGKLPATNAQLKEVIRELPFKVRVNSILLKNYIDSLTEVQMMAYFCKSIGAKELKMAEVTARNPLYHDFIQDDVVAFNQAHHIPIPDVPCRQECHTKGGTAWFGEINGVQVYFNAPPEKIDKDKPWFRVLFNDGALGYTWRREDGVSFAE